MIGHTSNRNLIPNSAFILLLGLRPITTQATQVQANNVSWRMWCGKPRSERRTINGFSSIRYRFLISGWKGERRLLHTLFFLFSSIGMKDEGPIEKRGEEKETECQHSDHEPINRRGSLDLPDRFNLPRIWYQKIPNYLLHQYQDTSIIYHQLDHQILDTTVVWMRMML